jgi:hypothetical protein
MMWFARASSARDCWHQRQSVIEEQCYPREDILGSLSDAGFHEIAFYMATGLGVGYDLGHGRMFVSSKA